MIFVFGGAYSGKADYVKKEFGADCDGGAVVRDIHLYIRSVMENGKDPYGAVDSLISKNPDVILISNEIGSGIVPLDAFEREWRETVGRIHCILAEKADRVIRVICGIGVCLK